MSVITILIVVLLVLFLLGGVAPWGSFSGPGHFYGGGPWGGGLGLILVIVLLVVLLR